MKITIRELMEKVDDIKRIIDKLDKMPEHVECIAALQYVDMLLDTKVDI